MNKAPGGVEPSTFCLLGRRSNQLSYRAVAMVAWSFKFIYIQTSIIRQSVRMLAKDITAVAFT